ncbi:DNA mismatch repair protein MutS [Candidatus Pacearchaeota archaeon]|nr:MAG: DNA mismatch repair protein MutS [Candidatus Pacearchaeota archaeon]
MQYPPLLRQYKKIKQKYQEEILLFRVGDFYETFYDDAKKMSEILGLTLTSKPMGKNIRVPLAGIPVKAAETYISKLLKAGYSVAICEQLEEPSKGKKLLKRDVVEVITPGTNLNLGLIEESETVYIVGIWDGGRRWGVALCEYTTGDFFIFENEKEKCLEILKNISPKEIIIPENSEIKKYLEDFKNIPIHEIFDFEFDEENLKEFFGIKNFETFGVADIYLGLKAGAGLLSFLQEKKKGLLNHIKSIRRFNISERMYLDKRTIKNLEIIEPVYQGKTLFDILNKTKTAMGKRKLKRDLISPFVDISRIKERLKRVNYFYQNYEKLEKLLDALSKIVDLERYMSRIATFKITPKELKKFAHSILNLKEIEELTKDAFKWLDYEDIVEMAKKIDRWIVDEPEEGYIIQDGVNEELDEYRRLAKYGKDEILKIEQRERKRTGIQSLKIGFNQVFGYYIEITKANLNKVPSDYIEKQTLTNAKRFITPELKELEEKILNAEEKIEKLQNEIYKKLIEETSKFVEKLKEISELISEIDVVASLAKVALENNYIMPEVTSDSALFIKEGRHPVVEKTINETFIPNDTLMDKNERIFIITGPNMAGKSTYLRQVALIVLMAQIGSFVPAKEAKIGLVDRIFSRIGASDDISKGVSTFMAEMMETAEILYNATEKSLLILDEIGRGTSTYDGLAIACSVVEYISKKIKARTLFATHYHELPKLTKNLPAVVSYKILVKEWKNEIIFMHKVVKGEADRSYGIYVAKIAGLPKEVIKKAESILEILEQQTKEERKKIGQLSLF